MLINLEEITSEGKNFDFSDRDNEITSDIEDVLFNKSFKVHLNIRPLRDIYEVKGTIGADLHTPCAKCGDDLPFPVNISISEMLMIRPRPERNDKQKRVHSVEVSEQAPFVTELDSPFFDPGKFIRELIVVSEPIRHWCNQPECPNLTQLQRQTPDIDCETVAESPFAALRNLKLN